MSRIIMRLIFVRLSIDNFANAECKGTGKSTVSLLVSTFAGLFMLIN